MPLVLEEHDGTSNSSTMIANVENSNAAAAIDLENHKKMTSMRLLVAIRNASTAAVATSTGDFGVAETFVHALAYGLEGELLLGALGEPAGTLDPRSGAGQLAELQSRSGGLPAWTDGSGSPRCDATAQAVRIWAVVGEPAHVAPIERALAFLAERQHPSGGLVYEADGGDVNTWASCFADQAAAWSHGAADVRHGG